MASCDQVRRAWHAALDEGRSDPNVAAHMRSCASCRDYAAEMTALLRVLDGARMQTQGLCLPTGGSERGSRSRAAPWRSGVLRWAAAVALLVGGGYAGWRAGWFRNDADVPRGVARRPAGDADVMIRDASDAVAAEDSPVLAEARGHDRRLETPHRAPELRPATEVTPIGEGADRCIVVAADLPEHPRVKVYLVYTSVAPAAPETTQGSG
ncbi:MAG: hypothetical protein BroJett003_16360 [Planctomycetota bacterium]|nr:MAG: hypothetical protein BroJett003_16360 [Planctomycetota bacterium]